MNKKLQAALIKTPVFTVAKDATGTYVNCPVSDGPPGLKPESVWSVLDQSPPSPNELETLEKKVEAAWETVQSRQSVVAAEEAIFAKTLATYRAAANEFQERFKVAVSQLTGSTSEIAREADLIEAQLADDFVRFGNAYLSAEGRLGDARDSLRRAERQYHEAQYLLRQARAQALTEVAK